MGYDDLLRNLLEDAYQRGYTLGFDHGRTEARGDEQRRLTLAAHRGAAVGSIARDFARWTSPATPTGSPTEAGGADAE